MSFYRTILLIDDDIEDQEIFMDAINEIAPGVDCFCEDDGELALQRLSDGVLKKPEILFIDLNMPKLNGKQLLQELKKKDQLRDIPVIMFSTFFGNTDVEEMSASGAVHFMLKSTKFDDLCAALKYVLTQQW